MLKPLVEFVAALHKNNVNDKHLQHCVKTIVRGEDVIISLELPDEGQYGLDLYTRYDRIFNTRLTQLIFRDATQTLIDDKQKSLLTHACKC
jgi:hypothetical protein